MPRSRRTPPAVFGEPNEEGIRPFIGKQLEYGERYSAYGIDRPNYGKPKSLRSAGTQQI